MKESAKSATGLEIFDKTIQTANAWLDEMIEEMGPDGASAALCVRLPAASASVAAAAAGRMVRRILVFRWLCGGRHSCLR
jgi:hypothetical protein